MSLRVQCDHCGAVMTVRDDYAGTRRRCPKCKQQFDIPEVGLPDDAAAESAHGSGDGDRQGDADEFDPVAFLSGDSPDSKSDSSSKLNPGKLKGQKTDKPQEPADFDPLDVLNDSPAIGSGNISRAVPPSSAQSPSPSDSTKGAAKNPKGPPRRSVPPAAAPEEPEFDPLDVLGEGPQPPAPAVPAPPPVKEPPAPSSETPSAETSSTAAPAAQTPADAQEPTPPADIPMLHPRSRTIEEPVAEILPEGAELPKYRRPVKRSTPVEELPDEDFDNAGRPQPKAVPKRPSWAKPTAEEPASPPPPAANSPTPGPPAKPAGPADISTEGPPPPGAKASQPSFTPDPQTAGTGSYEKVDTSPAARAAAAAMGGAAAESKKPAAEDEPDDPIVDVEAIAASLKRRKSLLAGGVVSAIVLYFVSNWFVNSGFYGDPPRWPDCLPVTGRVVRAGAPIAGARVIFHNASKNMRTPEAITDSDGRYTLHLVNGIAGSPEGRFVVQVEHLSGNYDDIPAKFGSRSTHTRVVAEDYIKDGSVVVDIDVAPAK